MLTSLWFNLKKSNPNYCLRFVEKVNFGLSGEYWEPRVLLVNWNLVFAFLIVILLNQVPKSLTYREKKSTQKLKLSSKGTCIVYALFFYNTPLTHKLSGKTTIHVFFNSTFNDLNWGSKNQTHYHILKQLNKKHKLLGEAHEWFL